MFPHFEAERNYAPKQGKELIYVLRLKIVIAPVYYGLWFIFISIFLAGTSLGNASGLTEMHELRISDAPPKLIIGVRVRAESSCKNSWLQAVMFSSSSASPSPFLIFLSNLDHSHWGIHEEDVSGRWIECMARRPDHRKRRKLAKIHNNDEEKNIYCKRQ